MKSVTIPLRPMLGRVAVAPEGDGGVRRPVARALRRQHGRLRRARGHDRLPARSSTRARSSTSATATRCRATARSAAPAWRRRWTSPSASACRRRRRSPGRASRTPSTSWSRAARGRSRTRCASRSWSSIEWLVADYGFDKADAYQLVSQVGGRARGQHGRPALHGRREVPEALPARAAAAARRRPPGVRLGDMPWTGGGDGPHAGPRGGAAARRGRQGARAAPAAAQRRDPGRLLRPRACWRRGRWRCCPR